MGIALWLTSGLLAFAMTRMIETARRSWYTELLVALVASFGAGIFATALDFGGWATIDGRAFAFAGLVALAMIGWLRFRGRRLG